MNNTHKYIELAKKNKNRVEEKLLGYGDKVLLRGRILDKKRIIENEYGTFFLDIGDRRYVKINVYKRDLLKKYKYEVGDYIYGEFVIMVRKVKSTGNYSVEFKLIDIFTYGGDNWKGRDDNDSK